MFPTRRRSTRPTRVQKRSRAQRKSSLSVSGITVEVTRKTMKNIRLKVSHTDGAVSLSAPHSADDSELIQVIRARLDWIQRQQTSIRSQPRAEIRKPELGDTIPLWGETLSLCMRPGSSSNAHLDCQLSGSTLAINGSTTDSAAVQTALDNFYRSQLRARIPQLAAKWEPIVGKQASFWGIKKMKTRWGSCNTQRARIWLNLELTKHPPQCLDYVVVHELVHLFERNHNARFYQRIAAAMPDWETWHLYLRNY